MIITVKTGVYVYTLKTTPYEVGGGGWYSVQEAMCSTIEDGARESKIC